MSGTEDDDLYARGLSTLLASWETNARGTADAGVLRLDGVAAAVFPTEPERAIYNNAVFDRELTTAARKAAVEAMESAYADAGVDRFAAWVHDSDEPMCAELEKRGYVIAETTRVMGMGLEHLSRLDGADRLAPASWQEYLEYLHALDLPRGLLAGVNPDAYRVLAARLDGENVATGLAFDHEDDCAIFNLSTLEVARRRGFGTAITVGLLRDARARGCSTATLQATPIAEGIYASVGFRDLGQFLEFAPSHSGNRSGLP